MVEGLEDLRQAPDRARQTVDSVDEKHVVSLRSRVSERLLKAGTIQSRAAHLIGKAMNQLPAVLALYVRTQTLRLGFQRERLVVLVGGDSRIRRHAHTAAPEWRWLVRHGHVLSRTWLKGNPLHALDPQHFGEDFNRAGEVFIRHRDDARRRDLQGQRISWVSGSESDPWSPAGRSQLSPARRVMFHTYTISIQNCPTYLESARIVGMDRAGLIKLDKAARRLRCHVETLRLHIRTGRLHAVRGPHGAYYVDAEELVSYRRPRRGWPAPAEFSDQELEQSWSLVESTLPKARAWRDRELDLVEELRAHPDRNRRLYRLLSVHRLHRLGLTFSQIAAQLSITSRHARRLAAASVFLALRRELVRRDKAHAKAEALTARREESQSAGGVPRRRWPPRRRAFHRT